ncbi:hypothetical protein OLP47_03235 [Campylobacter jejuni]|nr:hypothetical protein [Campylobacter jejuni]
MENKNLLDEDMQQVFEYYLKNDSYLKGAIDGLKKHEARAFIGNVLSYEYKNLVENGNLKVDEKYKAILPPNLITILEYDKSEFNGANLRNFINDLEFELEHIEMELYDDPADFEGGDYYNEDSECDEDYTVEDWVEDQVSDIRDFLYALKDFKSKYR